MDVAKEMERFNSLSPDEAKDLIAAMNGKEAAMRSCWYCNGAHEHLKNADYPIICAMGCGIWYLKGFPAKIVEMRTKGEPVTEATMVDFVQALAVAD